MPEHIFNCMQYAHAVAQCYNVTGCIFCTMLQVTFAHCISEKTIWRDNKGLVPWVAACLCRYLPMLAYTCLYLPILAYADTGWPGTMRASHWYNSALAASGHQIERKPLEHLSNAQLHTTWEKNNSQPKQLESTTFEDTRLERSDLSRMTSDQLRMPYWSWVTVAHPHKLISVSIWKHNPLIFIRESVLLGYLFKQQGVYYWMQMLKYKKRARVTC